MRIPEWREFEFPVIATLRIRHFFDALFRRVGRSRFRGSINGRIQARQGFCRKYARTTDEEDFLQNGMPPDLVEPLRIREYLCHRNEGDRYGGCYTLREDTCTIADFCDAGKDLGGLFAD